MEQGTGQGMSPQSFSSHPPDTSCAATGAGERGWQSSAVSHRTWDLSRDVGYGAAPISSQFVPWDLSGNSGTGPGQASVQCCCVRSVPTLTAQKPSCCFGFLPTGTRWECRSKVKTTGKCSFRNEESQPSRGFLKFLNISASSWSSLESQK